MLSSFSNYDKSTNITHEDLTMISSMVGNIDIFQDLMSFRCMMQSKATLEFQRKQTVKQIDALTVEKAAMIQRIKDVTKNGEIRLNELEEPMKSEILNIRKNIKSIREAVTYGYSMVNRIKKMERITDSRMTRITNVIHNKNLTKLAEEWKAKENKNGING